MADERMDDPPGEDHSPRRRVRRRRSSRSSSRSRQVQTRVPFTQLRFARPRLPSRAAALRAACGLLALGLGLWAITIARHASAILTQSEALLTADTRGAAAGQAVADQLAAQARAQAAETLTEQDAATRQLAPGASTRGYTPIIAPAYRSEDEPSGDSTISAPLARGLAPAPLPAQPNGNVMGYTLPATGGASQ